MIIIEKKDYLQVGRFTKPFGVKGKIAAQLNASFPEDAEDIDFLMAEVDELLVPLEVSEIEFNSDESAIFSLEKIISKDQAEHWVGCAIYLRTPANGPNEGDLSYEHLISFSVFDEHHTLVGVVTDFTDIPSNPLLHVQVGDEELLLPANDELILDILEDEKIILLKIPDGIIHLNTTDQNDQTE